MKTLYQAGNRLDYANPTGSLIPSGAVVARVTGSSGFVGIAVADIAATTGTGQLCVGGYPEGVHTLAKHTGEAFTFGQVLYWDVTNSRLTGSSTSNTRCGRAAAVAASAATTALLILNQN